MAVSAKNETLSDRQIKLFNFEWVSSLWPYLLLLPIALLLFGVVIIPEILSIGMSFTEYNIGEPIEFVGLENYRYLLSDRYFVNSFWVNIRFVTLAVLIQMVLGIYLALHMAKGFALQRIWLACILAPAAMSPTVLATAWRYILNQNIGIVNYFIHLSGFERINFLSREYAFYTVVFIAVWSAIPYVFLFIYPARSTIPEELYESAQLDGANSWNLFRYITFPLLLPAIYVALVFRIIFTIRTFGIVWLLTQGGPSRRTELLGIYLYKEGFLFNRLSSAASVSVVILVITLLLSAWVIHRMYRNTFATRT